MYWLSRIFCVCLFMCRLNLLHITIKHLFVWACWCLVMWWLSLLYIIICDLCHSEISICRFILWLGHFHNGSVIFWGPACWYDGSVSFLQPSFLFVVSANCPLFISLVIFITGSRRGTHGCPQQQSCKSNLKPCLRRAAPTPSTFTNHIAAYTQEMLLGSAH